MDNLMHYLQRGNKFIIINNKLFKTICPTNLEMTHKINYIILPDKIILFKDNDKQKMEFKRNKDNIIDQTLLIKQNDNINIENNQFYQTPVAKESNPLKNESNFNNPIYNNHQNNFVKSFNTTTSRMINQMKDIQAFSNNMSYKSGNDS